MKIVIMRFGPSVAIPEITLALVPHFQNDPRPLRFPVPGGVISVFNTDSTPEEVAASLKEVSPELPFLVMPFDKDRLQLPGLFEIIGEDTTETAAPPLTIDQILDKVNATGMSSLTDEERNILNGGD